MLFFNIRYSILDVQLLFAATFVKYFKCLSNVFGFRLFDFFRTRSKRVQPPLAGVGERASPVPTTGPHRKQQPANDPALPRTRCVQPILSIFADVYVCFYHLGKTQNIRATQFMQRSNRIVS